MKNLALMTRIRRGLKARLENRSGQSTTEYILILAIVVLLATKMKSSLSGLLDSKVNKIQGEIEQF